ncbi:MAG: hypothetical protein CMK59_03710 [Proteobacteria bacterium]|nr:hypothetical protein [Pseudomonadota bacterium]
MGGSVGGGVVGYLAYSAALSDVDAWLSPSEEVVSVEPGRIYSAPLEYWSGLPLTSDEIAEDLQLAGYARTEVLQKVGDFQQTQNRITVRFEPSKDAVFSFEDGKVLSITSQKEEPIRRLVLNSVQLAEIRGESNRSQRQVKLEDIPEYVHGSILAVEDSRFYEHKGIDVFGLLRAVVVNLIQDGRKQGASTITQQLVKNLILNNSDKTYQRKAKEALRAIALERSIEEDILQSLEDELGAVTSEEQLKDRKAKAQKKLKDKLIEMYINEVYLGQVNGVAIVGVDQAARTYFGKPAARMTIGEAATLAGMISSPNRYSPLRHPERAHERRRIALKRMVAVGLVTEQQAKEAVKKPLEIHKTSPSRKFPWFVGHALSEVPDDVAQMGLFGKDVHTSIQPSLQRVAEKAVQESIVKLEAAYPQSKGAQIALVSVKARTGEVVAMVGGRDFYKSQFNRATQAYRPIGSIIKPIMTGFVLQERQELHPGCWVDDNPLTVKRDGKEWSPKNYDGGFKEQVRLREAIQSSRNIPMVNLFLELEKEFGSDWLKDRGQEVGLSRINSYPSSSLGAFSASPLEVAGAYTVIADGGIYHQPSSLINIQEREQDKIVWKSNNKELEVIDSSSAWMVQDMMVSVIEEGTARKVRKMGVEGHFAGKTGTTNDGRDAWFIGMDRDMITVVWVGFDDNTPLDLTGGQAAIPTWARYSDWTGSGHYPFMPAAGLKKQSICLDAVECNETGEEWVRKSSASRGALLPGGLWRQACFIGDEHQDKRELRKTTSNSETWLSFFGLEDSVDKESTKSRQVEKNEKAKKDVKREGKRKESKKNGNEEEKSRFRLLKKH